MFTIRAVVNTKPALIQRLIQDLVVNRLTGVRGIIDAEEAPCSDDFVAGLSTERK